MLISPGKYLLVDKIEYIVHQKHISFEFYADFYQVRNRYIFQL